MGADLFFVEFSNGWAGGWDVDGTWGIWMGSANGWREWNYGRRGMGGGDRRYGEGAMGE